MLKRIKYFFSTEAGLQLRMTLWVSVAVLIVASIVMFITSTVLRERFETGLKEQLTHDINNTMSILDQRMKRVEYITKTAASFVEEALEHADSEALDSMAYSMKQNIECVDVVTIALKNADSLATLHTAHNTTQGGTQHIVSRPPEEECLNKDTNWVASALEGRELWSTHFTPKNFPDARLQCFSVPIHTKDGRNVGMICTMILESWMMKMIKQYKTRQDIDLTIYDKLGNCVVAPDDYIRDLAPEDLLTEERKLEHFQWRVIVSADRHTISNELKPIVWQMVLTLLLLLVCIAIAIVLTVRYVARPFALKQEHDASVKASLERELQIAAETQQQLVPHRFPPFPDRAEVSIYATLQPAREVGGDLYDYFIKDDKLYFCLGDVSGKGAPASLFMAATHYLFRSVAAAMPIADALQQMNISLCTDNEQCTFVTFFFASLDLKTGMLEYCNAGHNPPILIHDGKAEYFAPSRCMPLAVWEETGYPSEFMQLTPNDTILLYTDGVTEAMNARNEEFGEKRTLECVTDCESKEPQGIIENILQHVQHHADGTPQSDDITMLCIKLTKVE